MSNYSKHALREQMCNRIIELWFPRKNFYARSYLKSDGSMAYAPSCAHDRNCNSGNKCEYWSPEPITTDIIYNHLSAPMYGRPQVVGSYAVAPGNISNWICFDADYHRCDESTCKRDILGIITILDAYKLPYYVEDSGEGFHIWVFCLGMDSRVAYGAGRFILQQVETTTEVEVFPKQPSIDDDKYGNLVKIPLGRHKNGKKCLFVNAWYEFNIIDNQYTSFLLNIEYAPKERLKELADKYKPSRQLKVLKTNSIKEEMYAGPPCTQLMYQARLQEGNRNNILFQLAVNLRRSGFYELEDVKDILWKWNERNLDPLSEAEFNNTVEHAFESNYSWGCNKGYIGPYCLREQCPVGRYLDQQETNQLNADLQRMGYGTGYIIK